jgi:hypothetical protein
MKKISLAAALLISLGLTACDRPAPSKAGASPPDKTNTAPTTPPPSTSATPDPAKESPKTTDPATPPPARP